MKTKCVNCFVRVLDSSGRGNVISPPMFKSGGEGHVPTSPPVDTQSLPRVVFEIERKPAFVSVAGGARLGDTKAYGAFFRGAEPYLLEENLHCPIVFLKSA